MANWRFTTPTVDEAPFAWNELHERFRIARGISVHEVTPGVYEQIRFDAYTNELGADNLPDTHVAAPAFWPQPSAGLNYFRGGYEHTVDDQTRLDLINSNIGITAANFTLL